jgi:hypothetical protein
MYDNPPEVLDWTEVDPDETALFGGESEEASDREDDAAGWLPSGFVEWFAVGQTLLPALLFLPGSQAYRLPIRTGAYAVSLMAFGLWWFYQGGRQRGKHPASGWICLTLLWVGVMILHPLTSPALVGVAQFCLYFAILSPVFWASAYVTSRQKLVRVLVVLLICNGINSAVGVMQVYDPDRWMPRQLSSVYLDAGGDSLLAASTFIGPDGRRMIRPPGLFDSAGAVAGAGMVATILGLVFCLEPIAWWKRGAALGFAAAGMLALYLSQVRASFVMTLLMMVAYLVMLAFQNHKKRVVGFAALGFALIAVGLSVATTLGGVSVSERFMTLLEGDPRDLYYQSRGIQVESAMTELVDEYPIGAGLGRWGMLGYYFGERGSKSRGLFAEVQPNVWMLDGGVPLLALYSLVLVVTLAGNLRLIRSLADRDDRLVATIVVAANVGALGLVFTFIPFGTAIGLQFWFLEGMLCGAMADRPRRDMYAQRPYFE